MSKQLQFSFEEDEIKDVEKENSLYNWCIKNNQQALLDEWDYKRNKEISPTMLKHGTHQKVWWKCTKGHEWVATIASRTGLHTKCPICCNQKVLKGYNDLASQKPDLAKEWDYAKNGDLTPENVVATSNKRVWWIKPYDDPKTGKHFDFSWNARISERASGRGCPYLSNPVKKIMIGFNDLETTNPELVKEWNYEKNINIKPIEVSSGSDKKVWWKCQNNHEWLATISSRVAGRNCPECAKGLQSSLQERVIYYYVKKEFPNTVNSKHFKWLKKREIDIYIPELKTGIEYDGNMWHRNIEKDLIKDNLCESNRIKLIRIREKGCPDYESSSIKINAEYSRASLEDLIEPLHKIFKIIDPNIKLDINIERDYTEILNLRTINFYENSLKHKYPHLVSEWDYEKNGDLRPENVAAGTQKKVWWRCSKGHSFFMNVSSRTRPNGSICPYCSNTLVLKGYNDLETINPSLAKDWNYEKNKELLPSMILPMSNKKVWWKCAKGHEWEAVVSSRNSGNGCPYCAHQKVLSGYNDLATTNPELLKEWDYSKNKFKPNEVMPGTDRKAWWICSTCNHSWLASISSRTAPKKPGCSKCGRIRVNKASMKKVLCIETGKVFESAKIAAAEMKLDAGSVRECARGVRESYKGYHFKYIE